MPPAIVPGMTPESRTSTQDGHILITGTGRSGTTLLVEYFTALVFDTAHTVETTRRHVDEISRAGRPVPAPDGEPRLGRAPGPPRQRHASGTRSGQAASL